MSTSSVSVRLKKGRERPVQLRHPWIFSGAIETWSKTPDVGEVVEVVAHDGTWLARGLAGPSANLAVRVFTWNPDEPVNMALFADRISRAVALREALFAADGPTDAYRLIHAEADGFSGLIVDRYADALSVRVGAAALAPYMAGLLDALCEKTKLSRVSVAADRDAVQREGLVADEVARLSRDVPESVRIHENGFLFDVDLAAGQKTGFYLDQRMNRQRVAAYAEGRKVLSAYCYTGAFEVYAAAGGAPALTGIDSSAPALEQARVHHALNATRAPVEYMAADVPQALRRFRDEGRTFDLIVLDPPRFVSSAAQKEKGLRAYKDINLLAMKLLSPGGILATFSCSGLVSAKDLMTVLGWAERDAERTVRVLEQLGQPADHPVLPTFPESEYLCGYICHVE